jgi:hypothetical protein
MAMIDSVKLRAKVAAWYAASDSDNAWRVEELFDRLISETEEEAAKDAEPTLPR